MRTLKFIALAFTGALAVALYLAIGEQPTPEFLKVGTVYATTASIALIVLIAKGETR